MASTTKIPILDFEKILEENTKDEFVDEMDEALGRYGCFYLQNHGVDTHSILNIAKQFFELPQEVKDKVALINSGNGYKGYTRKLAELTQNSPDVREGMLFGLELPPDHPKATRELYGRNLWPEELDMQPVVLHYIHQVMLLNDLLLTSLTSKLLIPSDTFSKAFEDVPIVFLGMWRYPKEPHPDIEYNMNPHYDYGTLAFLCEDAPGIEVYVEETDEWIEMKPVEGALLVIVGHAMEVWTGGIYKATLHRVKVNQVRLSSALFIDPAFDSLVTPLANRPVEDDEDRGAYLSTRSGVRGDSVTEPFVFGEYYLRRMTETFPANS
eukprot:CAMPEP_0174256100 /NCGR_PEP_ID=MMETSP0439-20130205/5359_1 /TAXON_ID=0 /ORGANISM="Stereomyxa ramosa, Strain Chinc5" /LENGTH=323 /DNA_ID=CAMNT_0015338563 /DNA_START=55 /DNA_END=1026 /DNA_ORIENTATION=-